jgi:hypothetical protein
MANEFGVEMQGCGAQGVILFARLRKPIQERRLKRNRVSKERSAVFRRERESQSPDLGLIRTVT